MQALNQAGVRTVHSTLRLVCVLGIFCLAAMDQARASFFDQTMGWIQPEQFSASQSNEQGLIRHWKRVTIPGASCGDGSPYHVFVSDGAPDKLAYVLMGGGACWDRESCVGPKLHAWIHEIPVLPLFTGLFSRLESVSPFFDYTMVHLPYCTGDVHLGDHVANYDGFKVRHFGKRNIELAIDFLTFNPKISGIKADLVHDIAMTGYSAGGIGTFMHLTRLDEHYRNAQRKFMIPDAPGLHWGRDFWKKFSPQLIEDYSDALETVGVRVNLESGLVADVVTGACERHPDWKVAVMQGSRDVVMSKVFGEISPEDHERQVFGERGLWALTQKRGDNCMSWIPKTQEHTFTLTRMTWDFKAAGITGREFLYRLLHGVSDGESYRSY